MADESQILRHWRLLRMLQTRGEGIPLAELASEAGVAERTIQRDLEKLKNLGFPLVFDEDEFGKRFWRMPYDFFASGSLALSLTEAISLHLADRMMDPLAGTYLADGIGTIVKKIRSLLPTEALNYFSSLDELIDVRRTGVTDYSQTGPAVRAVIEAAREASTLELRYRAIWRSEEYDTKFDPYGVVLYDADLFVVGYSHRSGAIRILKTSRIVNAMKTAQNFPDPTVFIWKSNFEADSGSFRPMAR